MGRLSCTQKLLILGLDHEEPDGSFFLWIGAFYDIQKEIKEL